MKPGSGATACILMVLLGGAILSGCGSGGSCIPRDGSICQEGAIYWVDSCGNIGEVKEHCDCGCSADQMTCRYCEDDCPAGRVLCSNECVDTSSDPRHCGGCDRPCPQGQNCYNSTCQVGSDCRQTSCTGFTYCDLTTGECKPGCIRDDQCGPEEICDTASHQCVKNCPVGRVLCSDGCVDTTSDPRHCGGCDRACPQGQICDHSLCRTGPDCRNTPCTGFTYCDLATGECKPGCAFDSQCGRDEFCDPSTHACECTGGFHRCSGICVSDDSPMHCGTSCNPCHDDPLGTPACVDGQCVLDCDGSLLDCGPEEGCQECCRDTDCEEPFNTQARCAGGICELSCPDADEVLCGEHCVNLEVDQQNCGECGNVCEAPEGGSVSCTQGECVPACPEGLDLCDRQCVDLQSDEDNCGYCNRQCERSETYYYPCSDGQCSYQKVCRYQSCTIYCSAGDSYTSCCQSGQTCCWESSSSCWGDYCCNE